MTITGGSNAPPIAFSFSNAASGTSTFTLKYQSYTVKTNFNCSGVREYGPTVQQLPYELDYPDGRSYSFTYEPTPGTPADVTARLASVTLPTGGTISYSYSGGGSGVNGIVCADGTAATITRTTPDGTTTLVRNISNLSSSGYQTTTVTVPSGDITVYTSVAPNYGTATYQYYFYEVARQVYSGSSTLLGTILTCYSSTASNCSTTASGSQTLYGGSGVLNNYYVGAVRRTTQWPDSTGISAGIIDTYDNIENLASHAVYDYGSAGSGVFSSTVLQTTTTTYANNSLPTPSETSSPAEISVTDSAGNTISDTKYTYNEGSLVSTSGTPSFIGPLGGRMNPTTAQQWVAGSTYLTSHTTYYDTGQVATSTDVNGNQTTYTYGSSSCGNSFPTIVSAPTGGSVVTSLATSATWNCTGGVQLTAVDVNGNTTTYAYGSDPYWRPVSVTNNATTAVVSYSYPTASSNSSSSTMNFNSGSSTSTSVTTFDSLGRTILGQTLQGPSSSNYDTVAIGYDSNGRTTHQTLPYQAALGSYTISNPGITTSYDALNRTVSVTDAGGGYVQYAYTKNDVLATTGPQVTSPSTENLKKRSLEYNGAGWLTSVCEVITSTLPAGASCGQTTTNTGYLSKYTYDGGRLITTQQNAQTGSTGVQTRQLSYDGLGRKISESIPEWSAGTGASGTGTYVYDTDSSGACTGTYSGDLIKEMDSAGNVTCIKYDVLHRALSYQVVSGTYASVTPLTYAVYDAATYSGTAMQNAKGKVAEAYTCTSPCSSKLTDIYFSSYPVTSGATAGGITSRVWESTPHSGGYFLTQDTYYANGALAGISAQLAGATFGLPGISYGIDGEGRASTATDYTHSLNLVTATAYNSSSSPTSITFGNAGTGSGSDIDSITYDPNTNRPTALSYAIKPTSNAFTVTSNLTWNANGSLQQFQYTDGNDSTKNQTCNYQADDLNRISSSNCGASTWSQTFSYDPFGNLKKTVPGGSTGTSYSAAYSAVTNQVSSGISPAPNYDANGNQLNVSTGTTLSWNAANQPISINGVAATYDALGRMVETGSGSSYKQFVFRPSGVLLAVYSSALVKGTIPLPGGDTAVYNSSGLQLIRHKDWLGSSRLATTWAHVVFSKEAYAPFGETYNEAGTADRSFTGQDQDTVTGSAGTGVYDYLFRKYDPSAGRWLSPDPAGWSSVSLESPKSLNRYAYVQNNPLSLTDLQGLECVWDDGSYDASDDVSTGFAEGCAGQGGTWVAPEVFESVEGNESGSWNSQSSSTIAFDWLTPSAIVNSPNDAPSLKQIDSMIIAGSLGDFFDWLACNGKQNCRPGAQSPLPWPEKWYPGNNYCGRNGAGDPSSSNDWACAVHDYNYFKISGLNNHNSFWSTPSPDVAFQLRQADRILYDNTSGLEGGIIAGLELSALPRNAYYVLIH